MRRARSSVVVVVVLACAALTAVTVGCGTRVVAAAGCKAEKGTRLATTGSFRFALRVGMPEKMYSSAQVKAMHPKTGEVMLRGHMGMDDMGMGGMLMGGTSRHLEVQICSQATGSVITNANPTIALMDDTAHGMTSTMPIAVMTGIGEGDAGLHYGNNIRMPGEHMFIVTVRLEGEHAVFHVRSPRGM